MAPRRRGVRRRRRGCRRAIATGCATSSARIRSRSTRTSGSSRPTTSAACWSATGRTSARSFGGRAPEYYRGGETPAAEPRRVDHDDHGDQLNFYKLSFEGTRRWRALKLWMSWKHLGTEGFGRLIEANDDLAALLARRCAESDDFEAIPATPELSVVCFRHLPGGRDAAMAMAPEALDAHQDRLQARPRGVGDGWLTTTRLRGATWLRAGIVNYLSTEADIDGLLATLSPAALAERGSLSRRSSRSGAATSVASRRIPAAPSRAGVVRRISEAPARP